MFERTFSFWRRWAKPAAEGNAPATAAVAVLEPEPADERRFWVRYPAELDAGVQLAEQGQHGLSAARLRDISRGGAHLLVEHEIEPGQLINLDLPGGEENQLLTVLACVVRAQQEPDGSWALGCVFSRELSDADLANFGARRVRHDPQDQRTWQRFACELRAQVRKIADPDGAVVAARVLNLSASGVGLLVDRLVDAGKLLQVELLGKSGAVSRTILACVVHVQQQGETAWALGCNFIRELSDEELQTLI